MKIQSLGITTFYPKMVAIERYFTEKLKTTVLKMYQQMKDVN